MMKSNNNTSSFVNKQLIIDKTIDVMQQHGVNKTSIKKISDAVGLSKASLYHHFSSKHDIIKSVLAHFADPDCYDNVLYLNRNPKIPVIIDLIVYSYYAKDPELIGGLKRCLNNLATTIETSFSIPKTLTVEDDISMLFGSILLCKINQGG